MKGAIGGRAVPHHHECGTPEPDKSAHKRPRGTLGRRGPIVGRVVVPFFSEG